MRTWHRSVICLYVNPRSTLCPAQQKQGFIQWVRLQFVTDTLWRADSLVTPPPQ